MIREIEHLVIWLLAVSKSPLEKCLVHVLCQFFNHVGFFFFFGISCMNSLCTLNINLLSDISSPIQQATFVFC